MSQDWKTAWEPVVARIGESLGTGSVRWGADEVERGAVRRFLEPLEFDCPLHHDVQVARAFGYRDIVAPYTSAVTFAMGPLWAPGRSAFPSEDRNAPPVKPAIDPGEYPPEATGLFATDFEVEFVRPPVVGDRLGRTDRTLVDVSLKETKVGRGAFLKFESRLVDAVESTVVTFRTGLFAYEPTARSAERSRRRASMSRAVPPEWTSGLPAPRLDRQRVAGDLTVGEVLAPVSFALPVLRLVMEAGVNRDFSLIHHNTEAARSGGAPEMYANTLFLQSMWEVLARNFVGCGGTIKQITGFRMGSFNCAGDTVTVRGYVDSVTNGDQEAIVELRVWSENRQGVSVGPGTVTVGIPLQHVAGPARG